MKPRIALPWIDFNLYLITDRLRNVEHRLVEVVEEALKGGVRAVQLREKDLPSRDLYELAYELRKVTTRYNARLFVNDRLDIAMAVDADGVHLGERSIPIHRARRVLGEKKLIGVSCHRLDELRQAEKEGADLAVFGPVFPTPSKAAYGEPLGIEMLRKAALSVRIPILAVPLVTDGKNIGMLIACDKLTGEEFRSQEVKLTGVLASLPERDVLGLAPGDAATVKLDAAPGEAIPGRVSEMARSAARGTGTYPVEIRLDPSRAPRTLLAGLTAKVEITRTVEAAAAVPLAAVLEADGDRGVVFLAEGDRARRVPVRIAFLQGERAVLAAGLDGAARVITEGAARLADGARIRAVP